MNLTVTVDKSIVENVDVRRIPTAAGTLVELTCDRTGLGDLHVGEMYVVCNGDERAVCELVNIDKSTEPTRCTFARFVSAVK